MVHVYEKIRMKEKTHLVYPTDSPTYISQY